MSESSSEAAPSSDAELIAAVASGDAASYVTLQVRHTPAARMLARQLVASPDEAEEVVAATFERLRDVLRRGAGPVESLRPYLLTAARRVTLERRSEALGGLGVLGLRTEPAEPAEPSEPAAEKAEIPNLGEPLFTDPAAAELESTTLARAYASLPERLRAAAWHVMIERTEPAEAATILGLTEAGVAELPAQVSAALSQAYLELYLSGLTQEACKAEAGQLGQHLNSATRGLDERTVRVHLRVCRECRGVAIELTGLDRSLRRTIAPIFLGPAAAGYLSAVAARAAATGQAVDGLRWMREAQRWIREAPRRMRQATRQQQAMAGGVLVLAAFAIAGVSLTLAASTAPQHRAGRPVAAAIAPPSAAAAVPSASPQPAPTRPAHAKPTPTAAPARSAMTHSSSPAPTTPAPTTPAPTSPAPTPTPTPTPKPTPSPTPSPHHRKKHLPPTA
jgi:DNA-directed RNA polymerase specialized sigma24 family protein